MTRLAETAAILVTLGMAGWAGAQAPVRAPLVLDVNQWQGSSTAHPVAMRNGRVIAHASGAGYVAGTSAFAGFLSISAPPGAGGGTGWGDVDVLFRSASDGSAVVGTPRETAAGVVCFVNSASDPLSVWRLPQTPGAARIPVLTTAQVLEPQFYSPCNGGFATMTFDSPFTLNQARLFWTDGSGAPEHAAPIADLTSIPPTEYGLYESFALEDGRTVFVIGRQTFTEPPPLATCDVYITDGTAAGTYRLGGQTLVRRFAVDGSFVSMGGAVYSIDGPLGDRSLNADLAARIERWEEPFIVPTPVPTQQTLTQAKFLKGHDGRLLLHAAVAGETQPSLRSLEPVTGELTTLGGSRGSVVATRTSDGIVFIDGAFETVSVPYGRLWFTDGTAEGTRALDSLTGSASRVNAVARLGNDLVVAASTTPDTLQVRRINADLTAATVLATERALPLNQHAGAFVPSDDGRLAFFMQCDRYGYEAWVTDGTPAGTRVTRDFNAGLTGPGKPAVLGTFQGKMILSAETGFPGRLLFLSDGTYEGTHCISAGNKVLLPFTSALERSSRIAPVGDRFVYFIGGYQPTNDFMRYDHQTGACEAMHRPFNGQPGTVWSLPGGVVGTIVEINNVQRAFAYPDPAQAPTAAPVILGSFGGAACRLGNEVFFGAPRLTATDGTVAGTRVVNADVGAGQIVRLGNRLIYRTSNAVYASDGQASMPLVPAPPAGVGASTGEIVTSSTSAYFLHSLSGQVRLWRTDGTVAGTRVVYTTADFNEGVKVAAVEGDTAMFSVTKSLQGVTRARPWISRGTAATTFQLADLALEWDISPNSAPGTAQAIGAGGRIYFAANDGVRGRELWSTSGYPGSARLEADILPGSAGSCPQNFAVDGRRVYFAAAHPQVGMELTAVLIPCGGADVGSAGGAPVPDQQLDNNDFIAFIDLFFAGDPLADCGSAGGVPGGDRAWDNNDFIAFITLFFEGC